MWSDEIIYSEGEVELTKQAEELIRGKWKQLRESADVGGIRR